MVAVVFRPLKGRAVAACEWFLYRPTGEQGHQEQRRRGGVLASPGLVCFAALLFCWFASDASAQAPGIGIQVQSLSCGSNSMTGAGSDACTVTLSQQVLLFGVKVKLSSNDAAVSVPGTVTVPSGSSSASFTATVNAVTATQTATLAASVGRSVQTFSLQLNAAVPALTLSSSSVAFGNVNVNSTATQSVTLTSSGTAALTISGGSVAGTGFGMSGLSFPLTLNPGQTAVLNIQFDPTAAGSDTGTVSLTSNASSGTTTIALSGTGQAQSYQVNLTWTAPSSSSDPVAGYKVYREASGGSSYQLLNASAITATSYTDTTVQDGATYNYYVESVDAQGNQSGPSNTYTVTIP